MVLKVSLRFTRQKEIWADLECSLLASAVQVLFNLADSTKMHLSCHWSQLSSNTPTGNFTGECVQQKTIKSRFQVCIKEHVRYPSTLYPLYGGNHKPRYRPGVYLTSMGAVWDAYGCVMGKQLACGMGVLWENSWLVAAVHVRHFEVARETFAFFCRSDFAREKSTLLGSSAFFNTKERKV